MDSYIKSPLNYVGGKHKILSQLLPVFPNRINTFIDLFGGGFNVGINIEANHVIYNDLCLPVVQLLEYLHKHSTEECLNDIDSLIEYYNLSKTNAEGYLELRNDYNKSITKQPIMFYVLICYAFNYQIRYNKSGEFNMPFGKNRSSFNPVLRANFTRFRQKIKNENIAFTNSDFREFVDYAFKSNDFLYCDPPYFNSTATYNENKNWTDKEEKDLLAMLENTSVKWALSNNFKTNPELRNWAERKGYTIHYLDGGYKNCNYHKKDKNDDIEVLITNY